MSFHAGVGISLRGRWIFLAAFSSLFVVVFVAVAVVAV
jgi:hypothetical protein